MTQVTRTIVLDANASRAIRTLNQVDSQIKSITKFASNIGKVFTAAIAGVSFAKIFKEIKDVSGEIQKTEAHMNALFKDRDKTRRATESLMKQYDYTKLQTEKFIAEMGSKITDVVSDKNLAEASANAIRVAQRISSTFRHLTGTGNGSCWPCYAWPD